MGEVKIRPGDIDQLYPGQQVTAMQFSAFERGDDTLGRRASRSDLGRPGRDPRTGSLYYAARVEPEQLDGLATRGLTPVPLGMPVEAFIKTEDRTILSFPGPSRLLDQASPPLPLGRSSSSPPHICLSCRLRPCLLALARRCGRVKLQQFTKSGRTRLAFPPR